MFLATLALIALPQQVVHEALGWTVEIPSERWAPQESSSDGEYRLQFVDIEDAAAAHPAFRVLTKIWRTDSFKSEDWARDAAEELRAQLKAAGLEPSERERAVDELLGNMQVRHRFACTLADGSRWLYTFHAQHLKDQQTMLASWCMPDDAAAQRSVDVLRAKETLTQRTFDRFSEIPYVVYGMPCSVPVTWESSMYGDATQALLEAQDGNVELEMRVFVLGDAAQAEEAALEFVQTVPDEIAPAVEAAGKEYTTGTSWPARFAIGMRTVPGWRTEVTASDGELRGWRFDAVFSIEDRVVSLTNVVWKDQQYPHNLPLMKKFLTPLEHVSLPGRTLTTIADALLIRYDSGLTLRRRETEAGLRYNVLRRGVDDVEQVVKEGETAPRLGEIWIEFRHDLTPGAFMEDVYSRFRELHFTEKPAWELAMQFPMLGEDTRGMEYGFHYDVDGEGYEVLFVFARQMGDRHLIVAYRTPRYARPELDGILAQLLHGLESTAGSELVAYQSEGVVFEVDPKRWSVQPTPDGQTAIATLRNTTLTTEWAPLTEGLFGSLVGLGDTLKERVESDLLGWTFEGEVSDAQYGDAAFGPEASVPAKYAALRRTDAKGKQWDHIYMVGDVNGRRCWAIVSSEVSDEGAAAAVGEVLATVLPR